jgi:hypothetical protein
MSLIDEAIELATTEIHRVIAVARRRASEHPEEDPNKIAASALRGVSQKVLRGFALAYVADSVGVQRRAEARAAEDRAFREQQRDQHDRERRAQGELPTYDEVRQAERLMRSSKRIDDPVLAHLAAIREEQLRVYHARRDETRQLREREAAYNLEKYGTATPTYGDRSAYSSRKLEESIAEWENEIRLKVTAELLATPFRPGDGTEVTWGSATIQQHQMYCNRLRRQGMGTLETAARHAAAIREIEKSGVSCLNELPLDTSV